MNPSLFIRMESRVKMIFHNCSIESALLEFVDVILLAFLHLKPSGETLPGGSRDTAVQQPLGRDRDQAESQRQLGEQRRG